MGHTDGTISSQDTVRKTKRKRITSTNYEAMWKMYSRTVDTLNQCTYILSPAGRRARFSIKMENVGSEAAASSLSNHAITKHLCKSM